MAKPRKTLGQRIYPVQTYTNRVVGKYDNNPSELFRYREEGTEIGSVLYHNYGIMAGHNYTQTKTRKEWLIKFLKSGSNSDIKVKYCIAGLPNNPEQETDVPIVHFAVATKPNDEWDVKAYGCNGGGRATIGNGRLTFDPTKVTCGNCLSALTAAAKKV